MTGYESDDQAGSESEPSVAQEVDVIGEVVRAPDEEVDGVSEVWVRDFEPSDLYFVSASRHADDDTEWTVHVAVMEFLVEDPSLEADVSDALAEALAGVNGVLEVTEQDQEVWLVFGDANGNQLTTAAANVIDGFADQINALWQS